MTRPSVAKRRAPRRSQLQELQAKLAEAEEALRAIREGEVDAIIVAGRQGDQVFSLTGSETVYRLIVETMKEAALTVTPDGTILFCNGQFGEFVQTPLERILGRPLDEFVASDQRVLVASLIAQSQKESVKHRVIFQGAAGSPVPAHVSATVLHQPDGLSICIVATDLTELETSTEMLRQLRTQKEALAQSEQRYRDLVERSPQAILVHSGGTLVYVNPAGVRLYGAQGPADLVGRAILDLVPPEARPGIAERIRRVVEQRAPTPPAEAKILRLDGHAVDVEMTATGTTYEGQPAVQVILRDITERKQAEAFARATNAINEVIHSTLDVDEIMQQAVTRAAEAIGCDTAAISLRKDRRWLVSYVHGLPKEVIGRRMNDEEEPHAVLAITTKEPVAIGDAFNDHRVNRDHMKKWDVRAVLVVPLITKDEAIGVVFFNYHRSAFTFHDLHLDFATKLASSLSLALENSRLFGKLQRELTERKRMEKVLRRQQQWDEALKTIGQAATSLQPLNVILTRGAEAIRRAAAATLAVVRLLDPKTKDLVLAAHRGVPEKYLAVGERIPWGQEVAGSVAASGQPRVVGRPAEQPGTSELSLLAGRADSLLCLPLKIGDQVLGTLTLGHTQPEFFDSTDLEAILPAAAMLEGAILAERLRLATLKEAEEKALLFQELDHRVRNHLAALISLLHLGTEGLEGKAADRLREMVERVTRLAEVHNLLTGRGLQPVDIRELAEVIAGNLLAALPGQVQLRWTVTGDLVRVLPAQVTAVALVLNELLTNCTKHAFPGRDSGTVTIQVLLKDGQVELDVHDNGVGLGSAPRRGLGRTIVETVVSHNLRGKVSFADDGGTRVTIRFRHVEKTPEGSEA